MKHRSLLVRYVAGASIIAGITVAGGSALAAQLDVADPPSPGDGTAQVVATWLVNFEDGPVEWNVTSHQVDAVGTDLSHSAPTFLIGDGDYSIVITGPEVRGRLADGEALFRRPTLTTHAAAIGAEPATFMEWTISADDTGPGSDPFVPGAGAHDIDIIRDWLAPSDTFTMKAGIPAFVMVTSGWVTTPDGTRIDAGGWATLQGDITLINGGEEPAVVLAAWISPVIELPAAPTTTSSTTSTTAPATTIAAAPSVPAPTVAPTTAAPVTTQAPATSTTTTWPSTTVAETTTTWPSTTVAETTTTWAPTSVVETSEP